MFQRNGGFDLHPDEIAFFAVIAVFLAHGFNLLYMARGILIAPLNSSCKGASRSA